MGDTPLARELPLDSESDRFALHEKARQIFGAREGDILMEHLPPAGWSHLASKDDLELTRVVLREEIREVRIELKTDMAELRAELRAEMADLRTELRTEMSELRAELKTEMAELRAELKTDMAELRAELKTEMSDLRTEIERGFRGQTWKLLTTMISSNAAMIAAFGFIVSSLR